MQSSWQRVIVMVVAGSVFSAAAAAACFAATQQEQALLPVHASRTFFLQKCSRCHEPERAYDIIAAGPGWKGTVAAMAIKDRTWMPPEAVRAIISYGTYYPVHVRLLFHDRCSGCHSLEEVKSHTRSPAQWRTMVTYMAKRRELGMTDEERALLAAGLSN